MAFTKITSTQLNSRGATTLPDAPTIPSNQLKEEFDAPAKQIVAPAVNNLIDELESSTAAASLGIDPPTGRTGNNVQSLADELSSHLAEVENAVTTIVVDDKVITLSGNDRLEIKAGENIILYTDEEEKTIEINSSGGGGGNAVWGLITGQIGMQQDLMNALSYKADKATSLSGYGITDAYTKSEVYSKSEIDSNIYTKTQADNKYPTKTYVDDTFLKKENYGEILSRTIPAGGYGANFATYGSADNPPVITDILADDGTDNIVTYENIQTVFDDGQWFIFVGKSSSPYSRATTVYIRCVPLNKYN